MKKNIAAFMMAMLAALPVWAGDFMLGDPTDGFKAKVGETGEIKLRVRLQPRIDSGSAGGVDKDGAFVQDQDFYNRRGRLELDGHLNEKVKFGLVLADDKVGRFDSSTSGFLVGDPNNVTKAKTSNAFELFYAFADIQFAKEFQVRWGKEKLPYSRVSLASSSKQLLVERPHSTEEAKKHFGDYYQNHLMFHGEMAEGMINYAVALGDGADEGKTKTSGLMNVVRLEFAPPGWVEGKKADAHLGEGQHLALGVSSGSQAGAKTVDSTSVTDRTLTGADLSYHDGPLTVQAEKVTFTTKVTGAADVIGDGSYVQAGFYISGLNLEPAVRMETYNKNTQATDATDTHTSYGFNWYLQGHSVKLGVNMVSTKLGKANLATKDVNGTALTVTPKDAYQQLQIQGQFYF